MSCSLELNRTATRGAHREEDSKRDKWKHKDKTKRDQDSALDRYVLLGIFWPLGKDRC